jgi:hypothetical protein
MLNKASARLDENNALKAVRNRKPVRSRNQGFLTPFNNCSFSITKKEVKVQSTIIPESNKEPKGRQKQNRTGKNQKILFL